MIRRSVLYSVYIAIVFSLFSCVSRKTSYTLAESVFEPCYASGFEIFSAGGDNSVIRVTNPWQGAKDVVKSIYVSYDSTPAPDGFEGATVKAPVKKVVCMSSSYVAMFDAIGMADVVSGVSGAGFISSPAVRAAIDSGRVSDVGYGANLNFELIASMNPDIVLMYGIADENKAVGDKLDEMGIPYGYIGDYLESSALGKAEWTVAIGELCGKRREAQTFVKDVARRYDSIKQAAGDVGYRPKAMLNAPYKDVWFLPGEDSYMVSLLRDAGADYLGNGGRRDMSLPVSGEKAYTMLLEADVWLNPGAASSLEELAAGNSRFMDVPAVENGKVFNNNRRMTPSGGSDFWESGVVHPDVVLSDLVKIFHPELSDCSDTYYYKKLE